MTRSDAIRPSRDADLITLATLLRGGERSFCDAAVHASAVADAGRLYSKAVEHGVAGLLWRTHCDQVETDALKQPWLTSLLAACKAESRSNAAVELLRLRETRRLLQHLGECGLAPLILKGTSLAYRLYPSPELRPRGDLDLLMPPDTEAATRRALTQLGYTCLDPYDDLIIVTQGEWRYTDATGISHCLDVHRTCGNAPVLARPFNYERLRNRAVAIPELGPYALGLGNVDAFLLACAHRAGSLDLTGDQLIWHWDIRLLLQQMSDTELDLLCETVQSSGLKAVCLDAIQVCQELFGTTPPSRLLAALKEPGPPEPTALYLSGTESQRRLANFLALPSIKAKLRWLKESSIPSAQRLRARYPELARSSLPVLYLRRAWQGARRLL